LIVAWPDSLRRLIVSEDWYRRPTANE
jgi:hypothetical protein